MIQWSKHWPRVRGILEREGLSRDETLRAVTDIVGPVSWSALRAAAARRGIRLDSATEDTPRVAFDCPVRLGTRHLVIPDTQVRPGVPIQHFTWLARYIVDKGHDVVIHLGDHWDMPSLSSYDSAVRKAAVGTAKKADIDAGNAALEAMHEVFEKSGWNPKHKILLEGNHDGFAPAGRLGRHLAENPVDDGLLHPGLFADSWLGWKRVPFLTYVDIDDIVYGHLFPFSRNGKTTRHSLSFGAANAKTQVQVLMRSCTAGHTPGLDTAQVRTPLRTYRGIIAGSFYLHDEEYMGPGNNYWRGVLVKHRIGPDNPNHYDLMEVSIDFLRERYR